MFRGLRVYGFRGLGVFGRSGAHHGVGAEQEDTRVLQDETSALATSMAKQSPSIRMGSTLKGHSFGAIYPKSPIPLNEGI